MAGEVARDEPAERGDREGRPDPRQSCRVGGAARTCFRVHRRLAAGLLDCRRMPLTPRTTVLASLPAALGLFVADSVLWLDPAAACSVAGVQEHTIDADDPDEVAPGAVSLVSVDVVDLGKTTGDGCGGGTSSCDGVGTVSIRVQAEDDSTSLESLGFTLELASGSLLPGINLPDGPVRGWVRDGEVELILVWSPEQPGRSEFTLSVRAVDAAGNVGEPTEVPVALAEQSGCAAAGWSGSAALWLVVGLAALSLAGLRRRAISPRG